MAAASTGEALEQGLCSLSQNAFSQRLRALNAKATAGRMQRFPEVGAALRVEPEIRAVAEDPGQDERRVRGDGAAVAAKFVDMLARQARLLGETPLRQLQWL